MILILLVVTENVAKDATCSLSGANQLICANGHVCAECPSTTGLKCLQGKRSIQT